MFDIPHTPDTIAAIATAPGRGGIGVVRISGKNLPPFALALFGRMPAPRHAIATAFLGADGVAIDHGLGLFFPGPNSFTGEDVLELHGHGGNTVLQMLLRRCLDLGARLAEPGEFTKRAFLNDKIDLAQAESVADLIDASSQEAVKSAMRSLTGEFSLRIHGLVQAVTLLRAHVEASIDFPEEEIDPADRAAQQAQLADVRDRLMRLFAEARQGALLRDGLTVALIGSPNVGKSTLLNRLAGEDLAIVTSVPGTTRDQVRATIALQGVPIHLIDTAGVRETTDEVERMGIARTWKAVEGAAAMILICEAGQEPGDTQAAIAVRLPAKLPVAHVYNKIDLVGMGASINRGEDHTSIRLSAKSGEGVDLLRHWLLETAGWQPQGEGAFMARARHLAALQAADRHLARASGHGEAYELFAEDLRLAQLALSSITGEFTADDLLGEIFSRFCVGK
jgi:tRNA modification GTPase